MRAIVVPRLLLSQIGFNPSKGDKSFDKTLECASSPMLFSIYNLLVTLPPEPLLPRNTDHLRYALHLITCSRNT